MNENESAFWNTLSIGIALAAMLIIGGGFGYLWGSGALSVCTPTIESLSR